MNGWIDLYCSEMTEGEQNLAVFCAIRSVAALHSKGYAWMDVKPANFVYCIQSRSYVAIDLEGVYRLEQMVTASAKVYMMSANPSYVPITFNSIYFSGHHEICLSPICARPARDGGGLRPVVFGHADHGGVQRGEDHAERS